MVNSFDQVHNYYENLVFNEVQRRAEFFPQFTADMLADVACLVLNRMPPRYMRHDADFMFYMTAKERSEMDNSVATAMDFAFQHIAQQAAKNLS